MRDFILVMMAAIVAAVLPVTAHAQRGAAPAVYDTDPSVADIRARAEAGDATAQYDLAELYVWGIRDVPCDRRAAIPWLEKAAAQGHEYAAQRLKMEREDIATFEQERAAALTGDAQAQFRFGADLYKLKCLGDDWTRHKDWLMRAVRQDNADALNWFGDYYTKGYQYYLRFPQTAPSGYPLFAGNRGADNLPEAIRWYKRAAAKDHPVAIHMLSVLYGMDSPLQDVRQMEKWAIRNAYRPIRTRDDVYSWPAIWALVGLCWYYDQGYFVRDSSIGYPISANVKSPADPAKSFVCHQHAAAHKMPEQTYRLGELYEFGIGTARDPAAAEASYLAMADDQRLSDGESYWGRAAMRLGLLMQARGDAAGAYYWLLLTPPDKRCHGERYINEDPLVLCRKARAARDAIATQLPPEDKARIERKARQWMWEDG